MNKRYSTDKLTICSENVLFSPVHSKWTKRFTDRVAPDEEIEATQTRDQAAGLCDNLRWTFVVDGGIFNKQRLRTFCNLRETCWYGLSLASLALDVKKCFLTCICLEKEVMF